MQKDYSNKIFKIGKVVKDLRISNKLTQQELAYRCDIDIRTIQRIEKGEYAMSLIIFLTIADVLQISPQEILNKL